MTRMMVSKKCFEVKRVISLTIIVFMSIGMMVKGVYGKIKLPGEIKITIQKDSIPGEPLDINIVAYFKIPFKDGRIELIIPEIENFPSKKVELWSGDSPNGPMERSVKYLLPVLSPGEFKFIAYLKFFPLREGSREIRISEALYIDVRNDKILSSNISFRQIKRLELREEIERRGLKGLSISEIKKTDPEIARRILGLSKVKGEVVESVSTQKKNNEKDFIYKPTENKVDYEKEKRIGSEVKKAPLTATKETVYVSQQTTEKSINNRAAHEPSKVKKAPTIGTKKTVSISTKQIAKDITIKSKHDLSPKRSAPSTGIKNIVSISNRQPSGLTKSIPIQKVAPLENTKKVVDISIEENKEKKKDLDGKRSNYKDSEQAKEKKKAM